MLVYSVVNPRKRMPESRNITNACKLFEAFHTVRLFTTYLANVFANSISSQMGDQQMICLSCTETSGCGHGETSGRADLHDNYNTWQCDQEKIERSSGNWLELELIPSISTSTSVTA